VTDRVDWASPPPRHPGPVVYYLYQNQYPIPVWLVDRLRDEGGNESLVGEMVPVHMQEVNDALAALEDTVRGRTP
jgi:hypothetical protein